MLNMDKEAIKELLEMEAVPVCNILGSLLGRNVKMTGGGGDRHGWVGRVSASF